MAHDHTFLQAIRESPDDDAPRLVYADWLEDHGQPERAEFIRVQCELARLPKKARRRRALERRQDELWARFEDDWLRDDLQTCGLWDRLPTEHHSILGDPDSAGFRLAAAEFFGGWRFERGFLAELAGAIGAILEVLPHLSPLPPLRSLWVGFAGPRHAERLARAPGLEYVETLCFHQWGDVPAESWLGDGEVKALAGAASLARLRTLQLSNNQVGDAGARALAGSPSMGRLRELYLSANKIGDAGVRALAESPHLAELAQLDLEANEGVGPDAGRALADPAHLPKLKVLALGGTGIERTSAVGRALRRRFGEGVSFW